MRVGNDLDGCYDSFSDGVHTTLIAKNLGHLWKSKPGPSFWNFYEAWDNDDGTPWSFEQFKELVDWGVDEGYIFCGNWRPNAIETWRRIRSMGHQMIILTDRSFGSVPQNSERNTIEALYNAGMEYEELHFTKDKTSVPVDVMVEDKLENYDALVANGVTTFLINRAWNLVPGGDARNRIDDIAEYADVIEAMSREGVRDLQLV